MHMLTVFICLSLLLGTFGFINLVMWFSLYMFVPPNTTRSWLLFLHVTLVSIHLEGFFFFVFSNGFWNLVILPFMLFYHTFTTWLTIILKPLRPSWLRFLVAGSHNFLMPCRCTVHALIFWVILNYLLFLPECVLGEGTKFFRSFLTICSLICDNVFQLYLQWKTILMPV